MPSPTLSPTDPVPRGLLTLAACLARQDTMAPCLEYECQVFSYYRMCSLTIECVHSLGGAQVGDGAGAGAGLLAQVQTANYPPRR